MSYAHIDAAILDALRGGDVLTPAIAAERWRVLALHSAISRLREAGYEITCTMRHERGRKFGEYRYVAPQPLTADTNAMAAPSQEDVGQREAASAAPDSQLVTVWPKKGKPYSYTAVGFADKPAW